MLNPETFTRESVCPEHGQFTERGGSFFGTIERAIWWGCPECNRAATEREKQEERARQEQERQSRFEARVKAAGIPALFRDKGFDDYVAETDQQKHALSIATKYAENFWDEHYPVGRTLVFAGNTGTGKTHLALSIAKKVMEQGTVLYHDVMGYIRMVREPWSRNSTQTEEDVYRLLGEDVDLLVIDEIGVQRGTNDEHIILFDIINRRYRENKPTILITNLSGSELKDFMDDRIIDRLSEKGVFVPFRWDSKRKAVAR